MTLVRQRGYSIGGLCEDPDVRKRTNGMFRVLMSPVWLEPRVGHVARGVN